MEGNTANSCLKAAIKGCKRDPDLGHFLNNKKKVIEPNDRSINTFIYLQLYKLGISDDILGKRIILWCLTCP